MSTNDTSRLFRELEKSLLAKVSCGDTSDYDKLSAYLSLAKDVHLIGERFTALTATATTSHDNRTHQSGRKSSVTNAIDSSAHLPALSPGTPIYFIYENQLVKIGISSSEESALYKKFVPLKDAELVCSEIEGQLRARKFVLSSALQNQLALSDYKIQTTVMALVASGAIRQIGRGKYAATDSFLALATKDNLMNSLASMPQRVDLLQKCSAQKK